MEELDNPGTIDRSLSLCINMPAIDRPLSDVYTCRRLIDLSLDAVCVCIYMPAVDRSLSLIAGEFFYDTKAGNLYLVHNGTGPPAADAVFVVPQKQVLVNISASQFKPATDVSIAGITYTAAAPTYMEPHAVPSAGDWALDRYGAIFLQVFFASFFSSFVCIYMPALDRSLSAFAYTCRRLIGLSLPLYIHAGA